MPIIPWVHKYACGLVHQVGMYRNELQIPANKPTGQDLPLFAIASDCWQWMRENVAKPTYNSAVVEPVNALENWINGASHLIGGKDLVSKLGYCEIKSANTTSAWVVQSYARLSPNSLRALATDENWHVRVEVVVNPLFWTRKD